MEPCKTGSQTITDGGVSGMWHILLLSSGRTNGRRGTYNLVFNMVMLAPPILTDNLEKKLIIFETLTSISCFHEEDTLCEDSQ